jgi:hypothetical protein
MLARDVLREAPERQNVKRASDVKQSRCQALALGRLIAGLAILSSCPAVFAAEDPTVPASASEETRYVPPVTNPYFNESAQIRTEIRPLYFYNKLPDDFVSVAGFKSGGDLNVVTVQGREAITDRLAFIFTKNGYADLQFDELLPSDDGSLNISLGAKYAAIALPKSHTYLTGGLRYEGPSGDLESGTLELQGGGDGFFDLFMSFETALWNRLGVETSTGFNMAVDRDHDATSYHAAVHVDYEVVRGLFGVLETNVITVLDEGDRTDSSLLGSFEGYDVFSFGSTKAGTVATMGFGGRYRLGPNALFGLAYEIPVTSRKDLIDFRIGLDFVLHLNGPILKNGFAPLIARLRG